MVIQLCSCYCKGIAAPKDKEISKMTGSEDDQVKAQALLSHLKTIDARPVLRSHRVLPVAVDVSLLNGFCEMIVDGLKVAANKLSAASVIKACSNGTGADHVTNLLHLCAPGKEKAWIVAMCDAEE